jgi:hypothetical protein
LKNLLSDFICGLQKLYAGTKLTVVGSTRQYHGLLVGVLGDTLATQMLGGFKEGVGKAYKPCRNCEVTCSELSLSRTARDFEERDEQEHIHRRADVREPGKKARKYWSRIYGARKNLYWPVSLGSVSQKASFMIPCMFCWKASTNCASSCCCTGLFLWITCLI